MTRFHISDLFPQRELEAAISDGLVHQQRHPDLPLRILNYTERAAYNRAWNQVTRACRGLIIDADGNIVARPFAKFFNYTEHPEGTFDLNARVAVTDKLDGCFPRGTTLNLWGGGTVTIDEVVTKRLPVTLVGMDERGELVPAAVTDWHHNGRKDHWLDIEVDCPVSRRSGAGGHANRLRVTVNHHIWVNGQYRPACEIKPGDTITTQAWRPSDEVVRLVRASLLGDGCLLASATKAGRAKYQEPHSEKQCDYVAALRKALGDCAANRADTRSGYGSRMVWAGSREYEALGELRREWYPDGVKRVPEDLSWLDDFAVAKWLMDDGSRQHFKAQADRLAFSTHSFSQADITRLGDRLADLYGITYHLVDDHGRGSVLVINSGRKQQIQRLWSAIAPHVHPSMRYKLPEEHRAAPYVEPTPGRELTVAEEAEVLSVSPVEPNERNFPSGRTGFDITTTTHNYMARGVLVHNSLGILYPTPDGHAIATRGSFTSEQAEHATKVWRERYAQRAVVDHGITWLFEIIYPGNRIVCNYGDMDDLVLLGGVHNDVGTPVTADLLAYPGPKVTRFSHATLADALAAPPRPGAEGVVICFDDATMVKVKQDDYLRLHRIFAGLNARVIWEELSAGKSVADICEPVPDEFHDWAKGVASRLLNSAASIEASAREEYARITRDLPEGWTRKDFAVVASRHEHRAWLFTLLDGNDPASKIWASLRPPGDERPVNIPDDTA